MLQYVIKLFGNACIQTQAFISLNLHCKIQFQTKKREKTQLCLYQGAFCSSELLIYLLATYFCYSLGHIRSSVCLWLAKSLPLEFINLLVVCQVNLSAKISFLCDQEVKHEEDALRTSPAISPQHANRNVAIVSCSKDDIFKGT